MNDKFNYFSISTFADAVSIRFPDNTVSGFGMTVNQKLMEMRRVPSASLARAEDASLACPKDASLACPKDGALPLAPASP